MAGSGQRFYDDDEAEQILRVAASMSSGDGHLTYDRLVDTAAELGISPEAVERAEKQVMAQRQDSALRAEFEHAQRQTFFGHLVTYLATIGGLFILNMVTSPHHLWFFWAMFGWGFGLVAHARTVFIRSSDCYNEEFEKWKAVRASRQSKPPLLNQDASASPSMRFGIHVKGRRRD